MAHQSERQAKQRDYYQSHREQVKAKVRECERKRIERERLALFETKNYE